MKPRYLALVSLLALLLMPTMASAQTVHPCDVVPVPDQNFAGQVKVQYCHTDKDVNGQPTVITQVKVYIDGNTTPTLTQAPVLVTPVASATGFRLYETAYLTLPKGKHTVQAVLVNAGGSADKAPVPPFPFALVDGLPSPLNNLGIAK